MSAAVDEATAGAPAPVGPTVAPVAGSKRSISPTLAVGLLLALGPLVASFVARLFVSRHDVMLFAYGTVLHPSSSHLLGTDGQGRDLLASVVYGVGPTFEIGLLAGIIGGPIGVLIGGTAGTLIGAAFDLSPRDEDDGLLARYSRHIGSGQVAVLAHLDEPAEEIVDAAMSSLRGTVLREPVAEVKRALSADAAA